MTKLQKLYGQVPNYCSRRVKKLSVAELIIGLLNTAISSVRECSFMDLRSGITFAIISYKYSIFVANCTFSII